MKFLRILLISIFITTLSFCYTSKSIGELAFITVKSGLILRKGPGRTYKKIITIPYLRQIKIIGISEKKERIGKYLSYWFKILFEGA